MPIFFNLHIYFRQKYHFRIHSQFGSYILIAIDLVSAINSLTENA